MSHPRDIKIKLLELAKPGVATPDLGLWLERAKILEAYVFEAGQSHMDPAQPEHLAQPKPGQPQSRGPARR